MQELLTGVYSGNIIQQKVHDGLICCHTSYSPKQFNSERHYHQNAHLSLVLTGRCAERKKETVVRKPGHLTFYHAGEPHQVTGVSNDSRHINIEVGDAFFKKYAIAESQFESSLKNPDTKINLVRIFHDMQYSDPHNVEFLLLEMLATRTANTGLPQWALRVQEYLNDRPDCSPSLVDLAAISGVHPVTISKYFRKYFACSLGEYLRKIKVNKAIELIGQQDLSLSDVAFGAGFADQSHFIRVFKNLTGVLPGIYQKH